MPKIILFAIYLLGVMFCICINRPVLAHEEEPSVLILSSYHQGEDWSDREVEGLTSKLKSVYPNIIPAIEYLDAKRFPGNATHERMKSILQDKHAERNVDILVVLDNAALEFIKQYHSVLFADAAIVFAGINGFEPAMIEGIPNVTGVTEDQDMAGTLDLILQLHPETKKVLAIHDQTSSGLAVKRDLEAALPAYAHRVTVEFTPKMTMKELQEKLRTLPDDYAVMLLSYVTDGAGTTFTRKEGTDLICRASKRPVYAMHQTRMGHGIIGGPLLSGTEHGGQAAELIIKIAKGESASKIPIQKSRSSVYFDYKVMKRFGIPESSLPEGATILNRPPSIFRDHPDKVTGALLLFLLETLLIALLVTKSQKLRIASRQVQESEERYRELVEHMGDGVGVYKPVEGGKRFVISRINPAGMKFSNMDGLDITGKFLDEVFPGVEAMGFPKILRMVSETGEPLYFPALEYSYNGMTKWFDNYVYRLSTGEIVAVFRDVTVTKQAEEKLVWMTSLLNESQRLAKLGSWEWDLKANEVRWSDETYQIFNVTKDEYIPDFRSNAQFIYPDDLHQYEVLFEDAIKSGTPLVYDVRVITSGGAIKNCLVLGQANHDSSGNVVRIAGTIQDITEQKEAEAEKEKLRAQLTQAQKMESIGRLAGGVAHDFNNMLTVIIGHAEVGLMDTTLSEIMMHHLHEIHDAGKRSADITRQLLAFARQQNVAPRIIDLNDAVSSMIKMLNRLIGEDIELNWVPGHQLNKIKMDPAQIDQLLANLCINARDAISDTGKIFIHTENVTLCEMETESLADVSPGEYVLLSVRDTGHGMPPDVLEHIFEPFFTTKEQGKGTGLGLATVFGIVKQNGGAIKVVSEPGNGATFSIYLPVTLDKESNGSIKSESALEYGSETILLVEDEPSVLILVSSMLTSLGYKVLEASTPDEALRIAESEKCSFHLLVTDVVMPQMNGKELASRIETLCPNIHCLFMSGHNTSILSRQGAVNEGVHLLVKPFSLPGLAKKVREALNE